MGAVRLYRERDADGLLPFALDTVAYANLPGLVSVYRRDLTEPFQLQPLDQDGRQVNHLWGDDAARALAGAISAAVPDVASGRETGSEYVLRERLFRYWRVRLSMLDQVADFARRGAFTAFIDV